MTKQTNNDVTLAQVYDLLVAVQMQVNQMQSQLNAIIARLPESDG